MVSAHEILTALATAHFARPRPVSRGSEEMVPVPVLVALYRPGDDEPFAMIPVCAFALHPYDSGLDKEGKKRLAPERPAELILSAVLPHEVTGE